ncbi:hypothetical protein R3P38DRAFT_2988117, partial [Favolaschia claudopus]
YTEPPLGHRLPSQLRSAALFISPMSSALSGTHLIRGITLAMTMTGARLRLLSILSIHPCASSAEYSARRSWASSPILNFKEHSNASVPSDFTPRHAGHPLQRSAHHEIQAPFRDIHTSMRLLDLTIRRGWNSRRRFRCTGFTSLRHSVHKAPRLHLSSPSSCLRPTSTARHSESSCHSPARSCAWLRALLLLLVGETTHHPLYLEQSPDILPFLSSLLWSGSSHRNPHRQSMPIAQTSPMSIVPPE